MAAMSFPVHGDGPPARWPWILLGVATAAVWWLSIRMLWTDWEIDPQYSYGFLVPILCVALFLQRWNDRPPPGNVSSPTGCAVAGQGGVVFLALAQPFFEANPEWRIPGLIGAVAFTGWVLMILLSWGGVAWARHFAFPVCFYLISVPWPRNFEEALMGGLMESNAIAALEVLHWCGQEAVRRGHLIALPTGTIGVEEACSGVRSLQSGIMAALFFGEMYRFGAFSRFAMVGLAVLLALAGNFLRATGLSLIAAAEGIAAVDQWHDAAGYAVLAATLGGLWLAARAYQNRRPSAAGGFSSTESPAPLGRGTLFVAGTALALATASLGATEWWYASREGRRIAPEAGWTLVAGANRARQVDIPDRTRRMLFFPEGFSERFVGSEGNQWQMFYFRWPPGRSAVQAINIHDPRTCLASIGMTLERELPDECIRIGGHTFRFRVFVFRDGSRPVIVFHSVIAEGMETTEDSGALEKAGYTLTGRFAMVAEGLRNRGQRLIEAAVWNTTDVARAKDELRAQIEASLRKGAQP